METYNQATILFVIKGEKKKKKKIDIKTFHQDITSVMSIFAFSIGILMLMFSVLN